MSLGLTSFQGITGLYMIDKFAFSTKQVGTTLIVVQGRVIGPLWAGYLYEVNIEFPYISGAAALMLGLLVSWFGLHEQAEQ